MYTIKNLLQETEDFFLTDEENAKTLSSRLTEHVNNKLYYNPAPLEINKGAVLTGDYSTKNLRQSFFQDCTFEGANFQDAGLAGSTFVNSSFYESNMSNTNFQSCDFRQCQFEHISQGLQHTRFSKSILTNCSFNECVFQGTLLNDAILTDCQFTDCGWTPISIENTIFKNTSLQNVKFKSMNFEFCTFDNIKLDNVKLPFPTIPYIYNGLNYLIATKDNVRITSAKKKEGLTIPEYIDELDNLCSFYKHTRNYFPLTNILICKKKYKEAFASVVKGIEISIELRRFRMLRNYCKQLKYIEGINMHDRQMLYNFVLNKIGNMSFEGFEYANLSTYLPEVRQVLLEDTDMSKLELTLSTNIEKNDFQSISILLSVIEELLEGKCEYSIELRHNSPWEGFLEIFTNSENIELIIETFSMVFSAIQTGIAIHQSISKRKSDNDMKIEECKAALQNSKINITLIVNNQGQIQINQ